MSEESSQFDDDCSKEADRSKELEDVADEQISEEINEEIAWERARETADGEKDSDEKNYGGDE